MDFMNQICRAICEVNLIHFRKKFGVTLNANIFPLALMIDQT